MAVHYKIKFKTKNYKDVKDTVIFKTFGGQIIEIKLMSVRQPPALQTFLCKDVDNLLCNIKENSSRVKVFDDARASALNFTLDCGQCLLGERKIILLLVRNEGGAGTFFLMNEDDWYYGNVNVIFFKHF